jgi:hypothetical protein
MMGNPHQLYRHGERSAAIQPALGQAQDGMVSQTMAADIPENLTRLHEGEEFFRIKALNTLRNENLRLHVDLIVQAMNMIDVFRQLETDDEDLKLIQILGIRIFNAFGASLKLCLSGYYQNAAPILRDILETVFLLDLFSGDRLQIAKWRMADKRTRYKDFKPVRVRTLLDERYGHTTLKRAELYEMFSELAGHPSMQGFSMLRPAGMDAQIGPFFDARMFKAVLSEAGRLAVQVGEHLDVFMPDSDDAAVNARYDFALVKKRWVDTFYSRS